MDHNVKKDFQEHIDEVARKNKLNVDQRKAILLPPVGTEFRIAGIIYRIVYTRANPERITAVPVGVLDDNAKDHRVKGQ